MIYRIVAAIVIGYLLGSIPFAYIIARLKSGTDIRKKGSGNAGALAVWREVGPAYGIITLVADAGKGVLAVYAARWLGTDIYWVCAAGFAAVIGHNWPAFLGFRGGKGAATVMGVLLALLPLPFLIGLGIAVIVIIPTSNIRLGIIGLLFVPLIAWLLRSEIVYVYYSLFLVLFVVGYTLAGLKREMARTGQQKLSIVDKKYNFWQTRRTEKPGK